MDLILAREALEFSPNSPENALQVGDVLYSDEGILKVRRPISDEDVELFFWKGKCRRKFNCGPSATHIFAFLQLAGTNPIRHLLCGHFAEVQNFPHPSGRNTNIVPAYKIMTLRPASSAIRAARVARDPNRKVRYG